MSTNGIAAPVDVPPPREWRQASDSLGPLDVVRPVPSLRTPWDYEYQTPRLRLRGRRLLAVTRMRPFPKSDALRRPDHTGHWVVYFVFLPQGKLAEHHRFTLARLKDSGLSLLVVCACDGPRAIPDDLVRMADALYWKALSGYDFSAYRVGLAALATHAPGSNVLVLNDSMFGPFHDPAPFVRRPRWDLSGFTASSAEENHIQSYAFVFREISDQKMLALRSVFFPKVAFSRGADAITWQELRLARVASANMSVGACWFGDEREVVDPSLNKPFELVDAGFPFLKRSLLGKMAWCQPREAVLECLRRQGHPLE